MAETSIEWTDHSINPIRARLKSDPSKVGHFCQMTSPGCAHCYSSNFQRRFGLPAFKGEGKMIPLPLAGKNGAVSVADDVEAFFDENKLKEIIKRKKPTKFFWCDMTDIFGAWVPDEWINECFRVMIKTPQHTHQVLTKRADRMYDYVSKRWGTFDDKEYPLANNIWLGVSVENQAAADERIPLLLKTPAAVRFLSCEPLLGPIDLTAIGHGDQRGLNALTGEFCYYADHSGDLASDWVNAIDWVIAGGESGSGARPIHPAWAQSLRDQCQAAGVPFFFKQWGHWVDLNQSEPCKTARDNGHNPGFCPIGLDGRPAEGSSADRQRGEVTVYQFGKKMSGRLLDGREWSEFPMGATS